MAMKKTSLYIDDSIDRALAVRAAEQGITKAELIRSTLGAVVSGPAKVKPRAVALVKDGKPGIARDIDSYLDETGFGQ
jgi:plasmid stability protein